MAVSTPVYVILLRAIGPATHKRMGMAQWREASEKAGFVAPETVVNTGNMIGGFNGSAAEAGKSMKSVLRSFGLGENVVPIVRSPALLHRLLNAKGAAHMADRQPSETAVFFCVNPRPDFSWLDSHDGPEAIHVCENHLIVGFGQAVAQAGTLIRKIDKNCGTNTSRNWNSLRRIAERCAAREKR